MSDPDEQVRPVDLGLTRAEVDFMVSGFGEWFGPARPAPESATLAGFASVGEMADGIRSLRNAILAGEAVSRRDWRRALIATELIFGSDTFGVGVEWETVTGRDEVVDLKHLRELQRKLVGVCPPPPHH